MTKELKKKELKFVIMTSSKDKLPNLKFSKMLVVLEESCVKNYKNLPVLQNHENFDATHYWLIFLNNLNEEIKFLRDLPLNINSNVELAIKDGKTKKWNLRFECYNPAFEKKGELKITKIAEHFKENKYWRRRNMTGVEFNTAIVITDPEIKLEQYFTTQENRKIDNYHRFQSIALIYCQEFFNFTLLYQKTESWGFLQPNNHFDGLVGLLENKSVDFGGAAIAIRPERLAVIDYGCYKMWVLRPAFIYKRPKVVQTSLNTLLKPLNRMVWVCVFVTIFVLVILLKVVLRQEKTCDVNKDKKLDNSWSFVLLFTVGALCLQSVTVRAKFLSSRSIIISVFIFCILIYQFYAASIVSYLLMNPTRKINNLKDLLESNLKAGAEDILIDREYFATTTDPVALNLFNKKIQGGLNNSDGFYKPVIGINKVQKGGFAFHVDTSTAYSIINRYFSNQEICELEEIQMYREKPAFTVFQKKSPFRKMINYCNVRMGEVGIMFRLRIRLGSRKPNCMESAKKLNIEVGLKEFAPAVLLLTYTSLLSLIILVLEIIIYKKMRQSD